MRKSIILLFCLLLFLPVCAQRTFVLAVGISKYSDADYSLKKPASDARYFRKIMQSRGCNTVLVTNRYATTANLLEKLDSICNLATEDDNIVFFFSGHGCTGALITYDGIQSGENLAFSDVRSKLIQSGAKSKFCFVDACFSGSVKKDYTKSLLPSDGIFYFMSSNENEYSFESDVYDNGFFTVALGMGLRGLADYDGDNSITVYELYKYVHDYVAEMSTKKDPETGDWVSRQNPQLIGPKNKMKNTTFFMW